MEKLEKLGWLSLGFALLIIIVLPNVSILSIFLYDEKRIFEGVVLGFASLIFIWIYIKYQICDFPLKLWYALVAIFITLVISSLLAPLPQWAFLQIGWILLLVQLVLISTFLYQKNKKRFIQLVTGAFFLLAMFYVSHVLVNTFSSFFNESWPTWPNKANISIMIRGEEVIPQGFLGFSNRRFLNHLHTWSLPIMVFAICYYKNTVIAGIRYLMIAVVGGWWMLVFASDARGTMVASIVSLFVVTFWYRKDAKSFITTYIQTTALGLGAYLLLFYLPREGKEILTRSGSSGRLEVWQYTIGQISENPIWGLGPMHYSNMELNALKATPHNIILQSMVEWGIPAFIFATVVVLVAYIKFFRQNITYHKPKDGLIKITLVSSITAGLIHSMVSGILNTPLSQLTAAIIIGWAMGFYFEHSNRQFFEKRGNKNWKVAIGGILLLGNMIFVSQKMFKDVGKMNERNQLYRKIFKAQNPKESKIPFYPRFWQQGRIGLEYVSSKDKLIQKQSGYSNSKNSF